jgi:hypothetical protein
MRIQELLEARSATDLTDELIRKAKSLSTLYNVTLPQILEDYDLNVEDPSNEMEVALVEKQIAAATLRLASVRSKWFTENYMSVGTRGLGRGSEKAVVGLKSPLETLSQVPQFKRIDGLHELANLPVNMDASVRQKEKQTYGKLMDAIDEKLPSVMIQIGRQIEDMNLQNAGSTLARYIRQWETKKSNASNYSKDMSGGIKLKKQGDAYVTSHKKDYHRNSDLVKPQPKQPDNTGQQNAQVQGLIQQILLTVDPAIAKVVGPAISKVPIENRLSALRTELEKHDVKMESIFESLFR